MCSGDPTVRCEASESSGVEWSNTTRHTVLYRGEPYHPFKIILTNTMRKQLSLAYFRPISFTYCVICFQIQLGSRLLPAFKTASGIPSNTISISSGNHPGRSISVAEAGTLQLEFRDLSHASGDPAYQQACDKAFDKILSQSPGIVRQTLNSASGSFGGSVFTAGAGTDSYYEYQLKQWIQSGRTEEK